MLPQLRKRCLHQWNARARAEFKHLEQKNKEWQYLSFPYGVGKSFLRSGVDAEEGTKVSFQAYFNKNEKKLKMFAHFGKLTEGPRDHVHGGAISAMADTAMGVSVWYYGIPCVTANLSVNYREKVPLLTSVLLESKIREINGRKITTEYTMTDLQDNTHYSDGTALFIQLKDTTIDPKQVAEYWQRTDW